MNKFDFLNLSSTFGLIATGALTVNLLLGVLLSTKYKWSLFWQRQPHWIKFFDIYTIHTYTAYLALAAAFIHPTLLLFDQSLGFTWLSIAVPIAGAPHQYILYTLGAIAFYGLLAVVLTSTKWIRRAVSHRHWKLIHFVAYAAALLFLIHGLLTDPHLTDKKVDLVDAEKVLSEAGIVLLGVMLYFRIRFYIRKRASETYYPLQIINIIQETVDTKSFILDVPEELKKTFRYAPGQFITLRLRDCESFIKRCYTLSSSPDVASSSHITITVKRTPGRFVSNHLHDAVRVGDNLFVLPPEGAFFTKPSKRAKHYVMFAGGSGITPMYSIIKSLVVTRPQSRVTLIYANRDKASIIFKDSLNALAAEHSPQLSIIYVLTKYAESWTGLKGRIDASTVNELLDEFARDASLPAEYYICGPVGFMDTVEAVLHARAVPPERMHLERFTFSLHIDAQERDGTPGKWLEIGDPLQSANETPQKLTIETNDGARRVEYRAGETILDMALRAGFNPPYACQQGVCAACKATLKHGRVRMNLHEALTQLEIDQRVILTCQATPVSDDTVVNFDV